MDKNKTPYKILQILGDGKFHSGEALGQQLGLSRSAIWKAIQYLSNLELTIDSVTGKGYRLQNPSELLDRKSIEASLTKLTQKTLDQIIILDEISSTNDYLMNKAKTLKKQQVACLAEQQTHGKGRHGRIWVSPFGTNIYLSLLWHFNQDPAELMGLSLAIAVGIIRALNELGIEEGLNLKWPNDVLWQRQKLAGVLLEMLAESHGYTSVIIGVGCNTAMSASQSASINQDWVSLQQISSQPVSRNHIAALLINHLVATLKSFADKGLEPFLNTWKKYDKMQGQPVILYNSDKEIHGVAEGISARGELLLNHNHQLQKFVCGEISLRLK